MKVAIVTSFPEDPRQASGGVQTVSVNLVRALGELDDLDLHVITTDRSCRTTGVSSWHNATIHRLAWAGGRVLTNALGPGREQVQHCLTRLRPDVVHSHDVFGLMVKSMPLARVFTPHGVIYVDTRINRGPLSLLRSALWRWAETSAWADQGHIVAISPHVRDSLKGHVGGVIHLIDNPVAPEFFQVRREESPGVIFSAASISRVKNTLGLLEAFALLAGEGLNVQLRLAGGSRDKGYEARVLAFIRAKGMQDRVTLLGNITAAMVREELARASVFALVSLQEGAPLSVAEAMAAGVPIVASNLCGLPYMVRDGESGFLVDPADPSDIARGLGALIRDDARRQAMGTASRRIALDRFDARRVAARTHTVYRMAIRDHLSQCR